MKIVFDATIFGLQSFGGVSTYTWEVVRRLADVPGVALSLSLPREIRSNRRDSIAALPVERTRERLPAKLTRYLPLAGIGEADIVHTAYYRLPMSGRSRRVVTAYDFVYERYRSGVARRVHSLQKRRALMGADVVLCISENTRSDALKAYPDLDPAKFRVTPLAVDRETFFVPPESEGGLTETVLFVGQRGGYKRFDLAVGGVAGAGLRLAIVGAELTAVERAVLDRELPGRWTELGRIDDARLRRVYAGAYAFIYPSDYEGFGLPILEAQACGCPSVVANRSSFPEVGGSAAIYASEQQARAYAEVLRTLAGNDRRTAIRAAGLANVDRFSWERTVATTLDAYRSLAA